MATGPRSAISGGINDEAAGISRTLGGKIGNHADSRFAAVDADGVAVSAVQVMADRDERIDSLEARLAALEGARGQASP